MSEGKNWKRARVIPFASLKAAIDHDPKWPETIGELFRVTEFADFSGSRIQEIPLNISFEGRNEQGQCASFSRCREIKIAQGRFKGSVNFSGSGVTTIGEIIVTESDNLGHAADFQDCPISEAQGKFNGFVNFNGSKVKSAKNLQVTSAAVSPSPHAGKKASFLNTPMAFAPKQWNPKNYVLPSGVAAALIMARKPKTEIEI